MKTQPKKLDLKPLLDKISDSIVLIKDDPKGNPIVAWSNAAANDTFGEELTGKPLEGWVMPEDIAKIRSLLTSAFEGQDQALFLAAGGNFIIEASVSCIPLSSDGQQLNGLVLKDEVLHFDEEEKEILSNQQTEDGLKLLSYGPIYNPHPVIIYDLIKNKLHPNPVSRRHFSKIEYGQGILTDWNEIVRALTSSKSPIPRLVRILKVNNHRYNLAYVYEPKAKKIMVYCVDLPTEPIQDVRDSLTKLFVPTYMEAYLTATIARVNREKKPISTMMIEVDNLFQLGEDHGPEALDAIFVSLGDCLQRNIRKYDIACRYGRNEFFVMLSGLGPEEAQKRANKINKEIRNLKVPFDDKELCFTVSIGGVTIFPKEGKTVPEDYIKASQDALRSANINGTNKIIVATPLKE